MINKNGLMEGIEKLGKELERCSDESGQISELRICDRLDELYLRLKKGGGARLVERITEDEAGIFLLAICATKEHAPSPNSLSGLYVISVENLEGESAIVYTFKYFAGSIAQNVFIFLVHTADNKLRFFTVETSFPFALCEYVGGSHCNYGQVELKDVPKRIKEVLNNKE